MENKNSWMRWIVPLFTIVSLLAGAVGCDRVGAQAPAEEPTVVDRPPAEDGIFRLGIMAPLSGPSASTGLEFKGAATMALDAIDWQIGEVTIEPVWIDSQSDPDAAAGAYEQAIVEDGIQAAILNWHSSVAVSAMDVAADYQIPHIFPFGATETVNENFHSDPERYGYWMNKGWPTSDKLTIAYVQALEDAIASGIWAPEERTFAICAENTHWGRSFGEALGSQLEANGWTMVTEEYFALEEVQFHSLLNTLKAKDVALVATTSTSLPSITAFINQADEVGLESLVIADGLGWGGEWYELTGASSNYVIDQIPGWTTEEGHAFATDFEERWGVSPSSSAAGLAYDGTNMFIHIAQQALSEHGELTSETIYRWASENLQTGEWSYTDGIVMEEYLYTPETLPDPVVGEGYYMFPVRQYFEGQGEIVYPPEWATQELEPKSAAE
jgi:branched-chain amino acid transport system substrate-binding protein